MSLFPQRTDCPRASVGMKARITAAKEAFIWLTPRSVSHRTLPTKCSHSSAQLTLPNHLLISDQPPSAPGYLAPPPVHSARHALHKATRCGRPLQLFAQREMSFSQGVKWKPLMSTYIRTIPLSGDTCIAAEHATRCAPLSRMPVTTAINPKVGA